MKKLLASAALALLATPALADEYIRDVFVPREACAEIVSQEYSTGGGQTSIQILEILCRSSEGDYIGFVDTWRSASGFVGLGRMGTVDRFVYHKTDTNRMRTESR